MLYLEARCVAVTRAAGSQGVQNGGIDGVNVAASVPDGMREVIAENLLRDAPRPRVVHRQRHADVVLRHPPHRAHAAAAAGRLRLPVLRLRLDPGLRQRVRPVQLQRRGHRRLPRRPARLGLRGRVCAPQSDDELLPLRRRAVEALRAVLDELGLARFADEDVEAVVAGARLARRAGARPRTWCRTPPTGSWSAASTALDVVRALAARGYERGGRARARDAPPAAATATTCRPRRSSTRTCACSRRSPTRTTTQGPGTGYRMSRGAPRRDGARAPGVGAGDARRRAGRARGLPRAARARARAARHARRTRSWSASRPRSRARSGSRSSGLTVAEVLRQVLAGIEEEGGSARLVRVRRTIDVGAIGWTAARLAGSGIGIGLQAKGTALIHRADLPPLGNLELFSIAPRVTPRAVPRPRPQRGPLRQRRRARAAPPARVERAARPELPRARRRARGARARAASRRARPARAGGDVAELSPLSARRGDAGDGAHLERPPRRARSRSTPCVRGEIGPDDVRISARDAAAAGRIRRAGRQPAARRQPPPRRRARRLLDDELLRFYEMLRPGRSSALELDELARRLDGRGAARCAALVREARARVRPARPDRLGDARRRGRRRQLDDGARRRAARARRGARFLLVLARRDHRARRARPPALRGVRELRRPRPSRRLGEPAHRLLLAELHPVDTGLLELGRDSRSSDLGAHADRAPGRATRPRAPASAAGRLRRLAELDGDPPGTP